MQIADILSPDRVLCNARSANKHAALETLATLIAGSAPALDRDKVLDSFVARERLGSTGLGNGIALPHGRVKHGTHTRGAFLRLAAGIDFDAIDQQPVDLLFALLVSEESAEEHLKILAKLAELFGSDQFRSRIRTEPSAEAVFGMLTRNTHD